MVDGGAGESGGELGAEPGDEVVEIEVPKGTIKFKVLSISYDM